MRLVLISVLSLLMMSSLASAQKTTAVHDNATSVVITFKDGHQQSFAVADITRIEFKGAPSAANAAASTDYPGRFRGKWKVGTGTGGTFFITLDNHGNATKSLGASHGTWTVVGEEARISWDDGWHDAIRREGKKYEKFAYEPGKSFSDTPSNVAEAINTTPN